MNEIEQKHYLGLLDKVIKKQEWVGSHLVLTLVPRTWIHIGFFPALMEKYGIDPSKIIHLKTSWIFGYTKSITIHNLRNEDGNR